MSYNPAGNVGKRAARFAAVTEAVHDNIARYGLPRDLQVWTELRSTATFATGETHRLISTVAARLRCHRRTVERALARLEALGGLIRRYTGRSNVYTLAVSPEALMSFQARNAEKAARVAPDATHTPHKPYGPTLSTQFDRFGVCVECGTNVCAHAPSLLSHLRALARSAPPLPV